MKALIIARKTLREQVRDRRSFIMSMAIPAGFMLIFGLAFGGGLPTYEVAVVQADEGAALPDGGRLEAGAIFSQTLGELKYEDGKPIFRVVALGDRKPEDLLRNRDVAAVVEVPATFSRDLLAQGQGAPPAEVVVRGDPSDAGFTATRWIVGSVLDETIAAVLARPPPVRMATQTIGEDRGRSEFDFIVPGIMVFAILLLVSQTAMVVVREYQTKTLERLQLSAMTATDLFVGIAATQLVIAVFEVLVMLGVALLMGFRPSGSLPAALGIAVILSLAAVGIGLLVGVVARTPAEAGNLGAGALLPMTFLSGAFFPVPAIDVVSLGSRTFGLWDLLAPKHALSAMRQVMVLGTPAGDVWVEVVATLGLSILYLMIGIIVFHRLRLRQA